MLSKSTQKQTSGPIFTSKHLSSKNFPTFKQTHSEIPPEKQKTITYTSKNIFNQNAKLQFNDPLQATKSWYEIICTRKQYNYLPPQLKLSRESIPYRLVINKISGLPISTKKNNNDQHIKITCNILTTKLQQINRTYSYVCDVPINQGQTKFTYPIVFYYHSKIDKNQRSVKLLLNAQLLQLKGYEVYNRTTLGICMIDPFYQTDNQSIQLNRNCTQIQLITSMGQSSQTSIYLTYEISSFLQLKRLTKFIPQNTIVTEKDSISGIAGDYLYNQKSMYQINEAPLVYLVVSTLQVQIPDKFQQKVLKKLQEIPQIPKNIAISGRKLLVGYHNQFWVVNPTVRNMQLIDKETIGTWKINIYEAVGTDQTIKIPYYLNEYSSEFNQKKSMLFLSIIYQFNNFNEQIQIAFFAHEPNLDSEQVQINSQMIVSPGMGAKSRLLGVRCDRVPTLIMDYKSQNILTDNNQFDGDLKLSYSPNKLIQSRNKSSHKLITEQKQRQLMLQEVQRERLELERQRNQLQKLKQEQYHQYHQQFEKKFEEERNNLFKRQEMLQEQYRQEIQREIMDKVNLQTQIRAMKEKISLLEQEQQSQQVKLTREVSGIGSRQQPHFSRTGHDYTRQNLAILHKIDGALLTGSQPTLPVQKVRDILKYNKINAQANLQEQYSNFNKGSKFTILLSTVTWAHHLCIPNKIYCNIYFYNFKPFRTNVLSYKNFYGNAQTQKTSDRNKHHEQQTRFFTLCYDNPVQDQYGNPAFNFAIDPSLHNNPKIYHQDFINYLFNNSLIIDIFDSESELYMGQVNVKLNELLRGKKKQALIAKQCSITKPVNRPISNNFGILQILIKNQETLCEEALTKPKQIKTKTTLKRKIISTAPMSIPKQIAGKLEAHDENQAKNLSRQEQRIKNFKENQQKKEANEIYFDNIPNKKKQAMLQTIAAFKKKNIQNYLKDIYSNMLSSKISISSYFGQATTFIHQFVNTSSSATTFRVVIDGGTRNNLKLVKDPLQWKYFVKKYKYQDPKSYESINQNNVFYIGTNQSIPLLFSHILFDEIGLHSYNVTIVKEDNLMLYDGFTVEVQNYAQIVHHSYVLYEPGQQHIDVILPILYSPDLITNSNGHRSSYLTIQNVTAEFLNQYEILLKFYSPEIMTSKKFNLLLYADDYFDELLQNWQINIHSYEGVYTMLRPESLTKFKLTLPEGYRMDLVKTYCSDQNLSLYADSGTRQIWCQLSVEDEQIIQAKHSWSIQLTCSDISTKNIIYGWVVTVLPYIMRR